MRVNTQVELKRKETARVLDDLGCSCSAHVLGVVDYDPALYQSTTNRGYCRLKTTVCRCISCRSCRLLLQLLQLTVPDAELPNCLQQTSIAYRTPRFATLAGEAGEQRWASCRVEDTQL